MLLLLFYLMSFFVIGRAFAVCIAGRMFSKFVAKFPVVGCVAL